MTLKEAIDRLDAAKPNTFDEAEKTAWLSALDGMVKLEVIDTHEGGELVSFEGYGPETSGGTVLLIPPPYDTVYLRWLEARIDYANGESDRYNNSAAAFNAEYASYVNYYNRTHMPRTAVLKYFGGGGA